VERENINIEVLVFELREAEEQIESLLKDLEEDPSNTLESDLHAAFHHIYHHVNSAWNCRRIRQDYLLTMTDREFDENQKFPIAEFTF
jgi:dGTP triphosphohydrolase